MGWVGTGKAEGSRPALSTSAEDKSHRHLLAAQLSWESGMGRADGCLTGALDDPCHQGSLVNKNLPCE